MAFSAGDMVIPAATFAMNNAGAAQPDLGTLVAKEVLFGAVAAGGGSVTWNNGVESLLATPNVLRKVQAATGSASPFFVGQSAFVTSKPNLRGYIKASLKVELGTVGGTGALTNCSLLKTASGREILVPNSSLTLG